MVAIPKRQFHFKAGSSSAKLAFNNNVDESRLERFIAIKNATWIEVNDAIDQFIYLCVTDIDDSENIYRRVKSSLKIDSFKQKIRSQIYDDVNRGLHIIAHNSDAVVLTTAHRSFVPEKTFKNVMKRCYAKYLNVTPSQYSPARITKKSEIAFTWVNSCAYQILDLESATRE